MPNDGDPRVNTPSCRVSPQCLVACVHLPRHYLVDLRPVVCRLVKDDVAESCIQRHARRPGFCRRDAVKDGTLLSGQCRFPVDDLHVHIDIGVPKPVLLHGTKVLPQVFGILPQRLWSGPHAVDDKEDVRDPPLQGKWEGDCIHVSNKVSWNPAVGTLRVRRCVRPQLRARLPGLRVRLLGLGVLTATTRQPVAWTHLCAVADHDLC
mmetsp:Transcript_73294/g.214916  ORF Transcript_73294/g.214916 Transcript_73294/m.214916 type:complete len:207 (+) Transcript_73294:1044-1664(+)